MKVVISICKHELELADRWFDWVCELGGTEGHSLHLIPSAGTDIKNAFEKANKAFHNQVSVQIDYEAQTSDWQNTVQMRSASGPNSSFRQVAWDVYMNKKGHFFWCELDCIPLRKDWLTMLETQYKLCGKPFMGARVQIEGVPEHMSGNAVYPQNVPEEAPTLVMRTDWIPKGQDKRFELAFDVAGSKEVLPKAHWTNLIQHKFRFGKFESREHFDSVIDRNAVVFHSCKDGSIFKYLRENLSGIVGTPTVEAPISVSAATSAQDGAGDEAHISSEPAPSQFHGEWKGKDTTGAPSVPYISTGGVGEGVAYVADSRPVDAGFTITKHVPNLPMDQRPTVESKTTTIEDVIEQNRVIQNGLPAMSPPWENREDTEADVKMLCNALALFCKAPIYKSRVRNALREAKIIK